jgi:uncharacterized protein with PQ loop repeat
MRCCATESNVRYFMAVNQLDFIGWIGAVCFGLCGLPQCWFCFKRRSAEGMSTTFLALWTLGELCTLVYVCPEKQWPLVVNYSLNLACLSVIWRFKIAEW